MNKFLKTSRRGLALLLVLVMCVGMLGTAAFAEEAESGGTTTFTSSSDEVKEPSTPQNQPDGPAVCTKTGDCTAETHETDCPKYVAPEETEDEQQGEDQEEPTVCEVCGKDPCECEKTQEEGNQPEDESNMTGDETDGAESTSAALDSFNAAVEAMGDAADVENTLAALDAIETAYAALSDAEKASVAEQWAYIQEYAEKVRDGNPDEDLDTLEVAEDSVAKVTKADGPEIGYTTLQDAINAAQDGDTVTLLADVNENVTIDSSRNITLDLGDKTVTDTGDGSVVTISEKGAVTLKNGTVKAVSYYVGAEYDCYGADALSVNASTLYLKDIKVVYDGTRELGLFSVLSTSGTSEAPYTITVENCDLNPEGAEMYLYGKGTVTITSGKISKSNLNLVTLAPGSSYDEETETVSVGQPASTMVAEVGGAQYETLQEAITAAEDGQTVKLLKNTTESVTVAADQNITLNLNGKTLANADEAQDNTTDKADRHDTIVNNGTLKLVGPGTVDNVSHGVCAIVNNGTAEVSGCTVARSSEAGIKGGNGGNSYYFIQNNGTMTLTDVTAKSEGKYSSMVRNGALKTDGTVSANGTLTVKGKTSLVNGNTAVKNECGTLTVEGGTLTSTANYSVVNYGTATLNGGDYSGSGGYSLYNYTGSDWPKGTTVITGGKFHADDASKNAAYLAPTVMQDGNGDIVPLTAETGVAQVGETFYNSLQAAVNAARSGDEVVLLKTWSKTGYIKINKSITLNLNSCIVNSNNKVGTIMVDGGAEVTITNGEIHHEQNSCNGALYIQKGTVTLRGVKVTSNADGIMVGPGVAGYYGKLILNEDTNITGNMCGIDVLGGASSNQTNSEKKCEVIVNSGATVTGKTYGIAGNGLRDDTIITINGGTITATGGYTGFEDYSAGIYHPQQGTLTINGGTISGGVGVQMAGGTAKIAGGTLISKDNEVRNDPFKAAQQGDGMVLDGAALSLVSRSAYGNIDVTVTGGEFQSQTGNQAVRKYGMQKTSTAWEVIEEPTTSRLTVSGGTYSSDVTKYCVEGKHAVQGNDGKWTIEEIPKNYVAQVGEKQYETLQAAVEAAKSDETVKLLTDAEVKTVKSGNTVAYISIQGKAITLDLNGYTASGGYLWVYGNNAGLTVEDSSEGETGMINGNTYGIRVSGGNGTATVESGTVSGYYAIFAQSGTVNVTGGTVKPNKTDSKGRSYGVYATGSTINVSGGTVSCDAKTGIFAKNATVNLTGGTVSGKTGVDMQGGTITVADNALVNATGYGISLQNATVSDASTAATLTMTGGTVQSGGQAICGNNNYSQGTTATINSGTVKGGTGIYWPMGGTLTVSGDVLIEGQLAGIEVKQGTVNIEGGTIKATGEYKEYAPSGNGTVGSGWALAVSTQQYATSVADVSSDVVVNITGGTFESTQGTGIETINMGAKETNGTIAISGNVEVNAASGKDAIHTASGNQNVVGTNKTVSVAVSAGTYSSDVTTYCVEGKHAVKGTDGKWTIQDFIPMGTVTAFGGGKVEADEDGKNVTVTFDSSSTLVYAADGNDYGRTPNKWWAGIHVEAPEGAANAEYQKIGEWWNDDGNATDWTDAATVQEDGQYWAMVTPVYMNQFKGEDSQLMYRYAFDWNGDGTNDQYVTIVVKDNVKYAEHDHVAQDGSAVITEPTCTDAGYTTYTCDACGETFKADEVPAKNHSLTETAAKAATCTEAGNTAYWTCSECGKLFSDAEGTNETTQEAAAIAALTHDWGAWTATATQHSHTCNRESCEETETADHSFDENNACTVCGYVRTAGVTLGQSAITLVPGGTASLTATVAPEDATDKTMTWTSSNDSVATVANGVVTAVGEGTAAITVTAAGGQTATCTVTVRRNAANVTISASNTNLSGGGTVTLTVSGPDGTTVTGEPSVTVTRQEDGTYTVTLPNTTATYTFTANYAGNNTTVSGSASVTVIVTQYTAPSVDPGPSGPSGPSNPSGPSTPVTPPETEIDEPDVPLAELPLPFEDVKDGDWYREAVAFMYKNELMLGVSDNLFGVNTNTTRGMMATVIYRLENEPETTFENIFNDVDSGKWYSEAITWGNKNGIVLGYDNGGFGPEDNVTREQLVTLLYRYAAKKGYDVSKQADLSAFADSGEVSGYAKEAMSWAVAMGLVQGRGAGKLAPTDLARRVEVAAIFHRFATLYSTEALA